MWTIVHGLGYRPSVTVFTSAGDQVVGSRNDPDVDTTILTFGSYPFAGTAYLI